MQMLASGQAFVINQLGLCLCSVRSSGAVEARTYNFNMFPRAFERLDKVFSCQAGSLEYLATYNFDFNKMVRVWARFFSSLWRGLGTPAIMLLHTCSQALQAVVP